MNRDISISTTHLDDAHPNFERWKRAADRAVLRGELVCDLIESVLPLAGKQLLDAGCGVGGSSIAARQRGAVVTAVDRDTVRLETLREHMPEVSVHEGDLSDLPMPDGSFDAVILQDVIEHVHDPGTVLRELARVLHPDGILYLSTPSRGSIFNLIADPHFGLPFASIKKRDALRPLLQRRRPMDADRDDLAQLFSENEVHDLLSSCGFTWQYVNRRAAAALQDRPGALVWSALHLRLLGILRKTGLLRLAISFVPDQAGAINRWITPTWYLLCRKERA